MKRGRPKETKRIKLTVNVLPKTHAAIASEKKAHGTLGKVIDDRFLKTK